MEMIVDLEVLIGNAQDGRSLEILAELAHKEAAELDELVEGMKDETLGPGVRRVVEKWTERAAHYRRFEETAWAKREKIIKER